MKVSVIIPTFNRKEMVLESLQSLAVQTMPPDEFEVIVVDDGSEDGTSELAEEEFPYALAVVRQSNQGDAAARNTGARLSKHELLIFLDDDMVVEPDYLQTLASAFNSDDRQIVVGTEKQSKSDVDLPVGLTSAGTNANGSMPLETIPFAEVCSNNMSILRQHYLDLGMMQGLGFSGSSIWCDVEFSYRAHQAGFLFMQHPEAICWHRDYVTESLASHSKRARESAYRAVRLFQRHPELAQHLPMFSDKMPVRFSSDRPTLLIRKIVRKIASTRLVLATLSILYFLMKKLGMPKSVLETLYRWIIGGEIYRGHRQGSLELGADPRQAEGMTVNQ